jgi:diguanylate cyclase (GGDEF)-like protein/PAS domain S-box-containing protein
MNPMAAKLTGWSDSAARGRPSYLVFRVINSNTRRRSISLVQTCLSEKRKVSQTQTSVLISRNCKESVIKESASPMKNSQGETIGVVLSFYDVSEQHRLNAELRYRAMRDSLTGLYNRHEFESQLEQLVDLASDGFTGHAVMFIDLDQFKIVNDAAGHAVGDQLLRQVAGIFGRLVRGNDMVARLGGDEFGLIVKDCSQETAKKLADKVCSQIDAYRFQDRDHRFRVGASIGLVHVSEPWSSAAILLRAADSACYAAKEAGRNRVHTYAISDKLIELHHADVRWIQRIEHALDADGFALFWQEIRPAVSKVKRNTELSERKYRVETQVQACWRRLRRASGMHVWHEAGY